MDVVAFKTLIKEVTDAISGKPVDGALGDELNRLFPADGPTFKGIEKACLAAIAEGWMCEREMGGIKFGRVIKPDADLGQMSVDVVDMADVVGPHHAHPLGEVDMIMPVSGDAKFDGHGAGWLVYGPGSAHKPTVAGGQALVLYLLPEGQIEFTR